MRASRSTCQSPSLLSWSLLWCAAIMGLACKPAVVSGRDAGARSGVPGAVDGVPGAVDGGIQLPDGGPGGQGGGPAGAAGGSAGAPTAPGGHACAEEVHGAERVPVDLLLLLDVSESMDTFPGNAMRSKGDLIREALISFIQDPRPAGLGVGVRFFPVQPPTPVSPVSMCQSQADCPAGWTCEPGLTCWGTRRGGGVGALGICSPDTPLTTPPQACRPEAVCVENGRCALTGSPCYPLGQLCPGMMPGNVCELQPRHCVPPPGPDLTCEVPLYEKPNVPIASLPAGAAALAQALKDQPNKGSTPIGPALKGALAYARAHSLANPGHHVAVVLATDGFPEACEPSDTPGISAVVAAGFMQSPPISTFAIGMLDGGDVQIGRPLLNGVASAGGTGKAFFLNLDPNLVQTFHDALDSIRQKTAVPCEFLIPRPNGPIDFAKVNVQVQGAVGTAEKVPYVTSADRCDPTKGGWYYDVEPGMAAPMRVLTCPATCDRVKADPTTTVSLAFGCKTVVIE